MKPQKKLNQLLKGKGQTLSTAESCTGGRIAHLITSISGASEYYLGGIICYHSAVKIRDLGVQKETIDRYSVVSEEVALEMVKGVQSKFNSDFAVATTGNAGPTICDTLEEVGIVYIAIATPDKVFCEKHHFTGNRKQVIKRASKKALELLLNEINYSKKE